MLQNSEKSSNILQNWGEDEENLAIFTVILVAAFETKNVLIMGGLKREKIVARFPPKGKINALFDFFKTEEP